jgi:hypothetical protein
METALLPPGAPIIGPARAAAIVDVCSPARARDAAGAVS